ncbi:MAG: AMP-dependent synthetase/ligase [Fidelibacterota bacterium]
MNQFSGGVRIPTVFRSDHSLPEYPRNLAVMLNENAHKFDQSPIYQEVRDGRYVPLSWSAFQKEVASIQTFLARLGLKKGDRVAILSRNRQEMLETELAVMAMGAVSVPIFAGYPGARANSLVRFCEPTLVAVSDQEQYDKLSSPGDFAGIVHFDPLDSPGTGNLIPFRELLESDGTPGEIKGTGVSSGAVALMMYTSGTMGRPKCVQLTHGNILSQQSAMRVLWKLSHRDRFLSYLPWHHSFGGIFEKYAAITNGAVLSLENGYGKNTDALLENWEKVHPTVFFSVPRIYQELVTRALQDRAVDRVIFHEGLRFVFTAAAPLPENISRIFEERGIPVVEGWGLTETSPCCTVTDPNLPRKRGVVGKPIPGVEVRLADDGEILVKGPNVMKGYFKNEEATREALSEDGWFRTGDVGEFTEQGLRLISRKDRMFKLSNAEMVVPTEIENLIVKDCAFLSHAFVAGSGRDYPVALLFPNKSMFSQMPDEGRLKKGCRRPRSLEQLSRCLRTCLRELNQALNIPYYRLGSTMLLDRQLTIENQELTPSMKLAPNVVGKVFKADIERLYGSKPDNEDDLSGSLDEPGGRVGKVYVISLE